MKNICDLTEKELLEIRITTYRTILVCLPEIIKFFIKEHLDKLLEIERELTLRRK